MVSVKSNSIPHAHTATTTAPTASSTSTASTTTTGKAAAKAAVRQAELNTQSALGTGSATETRFSGTVSSLPSPTAPNLPFTTKQKELAQTVAQTMAGATSNIKHMANVLNAGKSSGSTRTGSTRTGSPDPTNPTNPTDPTDPTDPNSDPTSSDALAEAFGGFSALMTPGNSAALMANFLKDRNQNQKSSLSANDDMSQLETQDQQISLQQQIANNNASAKLMDLKRWQSWPLPKPRWVRDVMIASIFAAIFMAALMGVIALIVVAVVAAVTLLIAAAVSAQKHGGSAFSTDNITNGLQAASYAADAATMVFGVGAAIATAGATAGAVAADY